MFLINTKFCLLFGVSLDQLLCKFYDIDVCWRGSKLMLSGCCILGCNYNLMILIQGSVQLVKLTVFKLFHSLVFRYAVLTRKLLEDIVCLSLMNFGQTFWLLPDTIFLLDHSVLVMSTLLCWEQLLGPVVNTFTCDLLNWHHLDLVL